MAHFEYAIIVSFILLYDQLRTTIYFKLITTDSPNFYHKLEMLIQ